jgi:integrase
MVWTLPQLGEFLDAAEEDRLYAFFHLVAFRGLRRGEGVGQDWHVHRPGPGRAHRGDGDRPGRVDAHGDRAEDRRQRGDDRPRLRDRPGPARAPRAHQLAERRPQKSAARAEFLAAGGDPEKAPSWTDTGKVFVREDGTWLHPQMVSDAFVPHLARTAGLPPINLRDLRHQAATVIHAGGGDHAHVIKEVLRHSTVTLASDTYASLLPEVDREVAERAAGMVPRARRGPRLADDRADPSVDNTAEE